MRLRDWLVGLLWLFFIICWILWCTSCAHAPAKDETPPIPEIFDVACYSGSSQVPIFYMTVISPEAYLVDGQLMFKGQTRGGRTIRYMGAGSCVAKQR